LIIEEHYANQIIFSPLALPMLGNV